MAERVSLPFFLTRKNKWPMGFLFYAVAYALYYWTNHYPIFKPSLLPLFDFEKQIPFVPWTVLIYVSEYLFFTATFACSKDLKNLNRYLYAFLFTQALSCAIFFLIPTVYPREMFPLPEGVSPFLNGIWHWLRTQDAATNCFPSLHVSTVYLAAFIYRSEQKKKFNFFAIWGTLIALSTLPTKQHYFLDVVSGLGLALVMYWFFSTKVDLEYPLVVQSPRLKSDLHSQ